jgi:hypothetical protein|tara:strand:+ start:680 stop:1162 length:483 start_codon:yes stop_codon:yes gene_type:complete
MRQTIKIIEHEAKVGKDKKSIYGVFETSAGKYSCFKEHCLPDLIKNVGEIVDVEIVKKGNYENIIDFYGESDKSKLPNGDIECEKVGQPAPQPVVQTASSEPKYRINIKTSAKGHNYWECTVRGDDAEALKAELEHVVVTAKEMCDELNAVEPVETEAEE